MQTGAKVLLTLKCVYLGLNFTFVLLLLLKLQHFENGGERDGGLEWVAVMVPLMVAELLQCVYLLVMLCRAVKSNLERFMRMFGVCKLVTSFSCSLGFLVSEVLFTIVLALEVDLVGITCFLLVPLWVAYIVQIVNDFVYWYRNNNRPADDESTAPRSSSLLMRNWWFFLSIFVGARVDRYVRLSWTLTLWPLWVLAVALVAVMAVLLLTLPVVLVLPRLRRLFRGLAIMAIAVSVYAIPCFLFVTRLTAYLDGKDMSMEKILAPPMAGCLGGLCVHLITGLIALKVNPPQGEEQGEEESDQIYPFFGVLGSARPSTLLRESESLFRRSDGNLAEILCQEEEPQQNNAALVIQRWYRKVKNLPTREFLIEPLTPATPCVICLDSRRDTIFLECGHSVCCTDCAVRLWTSAPRLCPLCRQTILEIVHFTEVENSNVVTVQGIPRPAPSEGVVAMV